MLRERRKHGEGKSPRLSIKRGMVVHIRESSYVSSSRLEAHVRMQRAMHIGDMIKPISAWYVQLIWAHLLLPLPCCLGPSVARRQRHLLVHLHTKQES